MHDSNRLEETTGVLEQTIVIVHGRAVKMVEEWPVYQQQGIPVLGEFAHISDDKVKHKSKCDFLVLSGDKWREKKFLLSDKSA